MELEKENGRRLEWGKTSGGNRREEGAGLEWDRVVRERRRRRGLWDGPRVEGGDGRGDGREGSYCSDPDK